MAVFNFPKKEIDAKIVYCGPGVSGKTTNLQFIHQNLRPEQRGKIISLETKEDRTLFFDFLPIELASVRGFKTRFHLYTVPGQAYYGSTRRVVLTGADGVVFVADSHGERMDDNLLSFKDLEDNLRFHGKRIETIPLVIQYNKRDLPGVLEVEALNQSINRFNSPYFEGVAITGKGVFESLTTICQWVLKAIENGMESKRSVSTPEKAASPSPTRKEMEAVKAGSLPALQPASTEESQPCYQARKLQLEKPLTFPDGVVPQAEETPGRKVLKAKEVISLKPAHSVQAALDTPSFQDAREHMASPVGDRGGFGKGLPPAGGPSLSRLTSPRAQNPGERNKAGNSGVSGRTSEEKDAKSPPALEKNGERKSLPKERIRILSSGQPRLSSPSLLEVPLNLVVENGERNLPFSISLVINLGQKPQDF